jgi:ABC-type dipeptide/oligopeptide/nickel transport system ATPase component
MLQRAQLAAALCHNPALLIADEPTTALDVTAQAQIIRLLNRLKREKRLTLFIISHDRAVVNALSDRQIAMKSGRIIG